MTDTTQKTEQALKVARAALETAAGCFEAAYVEGLSEAIAETSDERLKDLLTRRILYAHTAAQDALASLAAAPSVPSDADRETVLGIIAWLGGASQGDRKNVTRGEAADALRRLLASVPAAPVASNTVCWNCMDSGMEHGVYRARPCGFCKDRLAASLPQVAQCQHKNSDCVYESDDGEMERHVCRDCGQRFTVEIPQ